MPQSEIRSKCDTSSVEVAARCGKSRSWLDTRYSRLNKKFTNALVAMRKRFLTMPKSSHRQAPETLRQIEFIDRFVDSCK